PGRHRDRRVLRAALRTGRGRVHARDHPERRLRRRDALLHRGPLAGRRLHHRLGHRRPDRVAPRPRDRQALLPAHLAAAGDGRRPGRGPVPDLPRRRRPARQPRRGQDRHGLAAAGGGAGGHGLAPCARPHPHRTRQSRLTAPAAAQENSSASSSSTSWLATKSSSSPGSSVSPGVGTSTQPSRSIATSAVSRGQSTEPTRCPPSGASSGSVSSTRFASPCRNVISRTRSPTLTASSTSADSSRGVDTATSTPHDSLNSHSLFGWLMRATTRGTPYSVLASSDTTRLTLSSPDEATTTWQRSSAASSSAEI